MGAVQGSSHRAGTLNAVNDVGAVLQCSMATTHESDDVSRGRCAPSYYCSVDKKVLTGEVYLHTL